MKNLLPIVFIMVVFSCSPKWSPDHYWSQKRWILTEMKGVPVQLSGTNRDAYLEFSWTDKHFAGNGGCNHLSGTYTLEKKKDIHFSEVITTKMSCPDIAFETTFLNALHEIDKFETEGDRLLLKDGKKTLLIFQGK